MTNFDDAQNPKTTVAFTIGNPLVGDQLTLAIAASPIIQIISGTQKNKIFSLSENCVLKVGRDSSNGIVIEDNSCSRIHFEIKVGASGEVSIKDASSTNGTFLNGEKIETTKFSRYLKTGDIIQMGQGVSIGFCYIPKFTDDLHKKISEQIARVEKFEGGLVTMEQLEKILNKEVSFARRNPNADLCVAAITFLNLKKHLLYFGANNLENVAQSIYDWIFSINREEVVVSRLKDEKIFLILRGLSQSKITQYVARAFQNVTTLNLDFNNQIITLEFSVGFVFWNKNSMEKLSSMELLELASQTSKDASAINPMFGFKA